MARIKDRISIRLLSMPGNVLHERVPPYFSLFTATLLLPTLLSRHSELFAASLTPHFLSHLWAFHRPPLLLKHLLFPIPSSYSRSCPAPTLASNLSSDGTSHKKSHESVFPGQCMCHHKGSICFTGIKLSNELWSALQRERHHTNVQWLFLWKCLKTKNGWSLRTH